MLVARELLFFVAYWDIAYSLNNPEKANLAAAEAKDREAKLRTNSSDEQCDLQRHQMFSLRSAGTHERKDTPSSNDSVAAMSHARAVTFGVFPTHIGGLAAILQGHTRPYKDSKIYNLYKTCEGAWKCLHGL